MTAFLAKVREPVLRTLAIMGALGLVGLLVALAAILLPAESSRSLLESLTWGPGLSSALEVSGGELPRTVVRAGAWEAASWPLDPNAPDRPTRVSVRAPLFLALLAWGLVLGLVLGVLWQSTATAKVVGGGFLLGAAVGLVVVMSVGALESSRWAEHWVSALPGFPGASRHVDEQRFGDRVVGEHVTARAGQGALGRCVRGEALVAGAVEGEGSDDTEPTGAAERRCELTPRGSFRLALRWAFLGTGVGLLAFGWVRRRRFSSIVHFALGVGIGGWALLALLPFGAQAWIAELTLSALAMVGLQGGAASAWFAPTPVMEVGTGPWSFPPPLALLLMIDGALLGGLVVVAASALAWRREKRVAEERAVEEEAQQPPGPIPLWTGENEGAGDGDEPEIER